MIRIKIKVKEVLVGHLTSEMGNRDDRDRDLIWEIGIGAVFSWNQKLK
jgi:hypothetical protein